MFGYVRIYRPDLSESEYKRYRSVYCGLCKTLGRELNQFSRMALTYDVTFICLLLFALTDEAAHSKAEACIAHPLKKHLIDQSHLIYREAAFLTAALVYLKANDNVQDGEKRLLNKTVRKAMKGGFGHFCREEEAMKERFLSAQSALLTLEKAPKVSSPFVWAAQNEELMLLLWYRFLTNLKDGGFVWAKVYEGFETELEERLSTLFRYLMRWIYFLDACDDWEQDRQDRTPNPFSFCRNVDELWQATLPVFYDLEHQLDCCAGQLSFSRDGAVIANVLRAGLPLRREVVRQKMLKNRSGK